MNEATVAEKNALCVQYDASGAQVVLDLNFVKKFLVRGDAKLVTDQEVVFFMNLCKVQKLNPLTGGEVYLIKYKADDPAQTVVGKGAYMRRLYEHPDYLCKEDGITVLRGSEIIKKEGCCVYPSEKLIGGWCRIHYTRAGVERSAYKEVALSEYDKGMANWRSKPATMINKVAISQCAREAFPKDYEGMYSEEEMIASGAIPVNSIEGDVNASNEEVIDVIVTQKQRQELFAFAKSVLGSNCNSVIKKLIQDEGLETTENMTVAVYDKIMSKIKELADEENAAREANNG